MSPELSTAFTLLAIGMITVFVVLTLVVITGNLMIKLVNKLPISNSEEIPDKTIEVLASAVETITKGQGRISKIEKL